MNARIISLFFAVAAASAFAASDAAIRSVEEGCADCTEAFQTRLDAGGEVFLPAGTYVVSKPLLVKGGTAVVGEPGRTRIRMEGDGNVFKGAGRFEDGRLVRESGFTFRDLVIEAREKEQGRQAIDLKSVENVLVERVETIGLGGPSIGTAYHEAWAAVTAGTTPVLNYNDKTPDPCATAGMVGDECLSSNIVIRSCHIDGGSRQAGMYGVHIRFATDCVVSDCVVMNAMHGIQFWGGDSFHECGGLLENDKRCKRVKVERCRAIQIAGGGVWGSMVEDFLVTNCTAQLCEDVGIDFEGSHRCEAVDCTAMNCGNGNYATFMFCLGDVAFRRCKSILDQNGTCHYFDSHYGAGKTGGPAERHVLFENCVFWGKKPTFIRLPCPMAEFKFVGNKCVNAQIDKRGASLGRFVCEGNTFEDGRGKSIAAEHTAILSVEEGCADCTAAFQKRLDGGGEIRLSAGTYAVSKPLNVKGGTTVVGEPGRTRIRMDGKGNVFNGAGRIKDGKLVRGSGFTFRDLVIEAGAGGRKNGQLAFALDSVENVLVERVETIGLGGLRIGSVYCVNFYDKTKDPCATAGLVGDECLSSNIVVRSCHFDGGSRYAGTRGVDISFATDCEIRDCVAMNVHDGFQFWGGDSFHERGGLPENDKRCKRVKVERCRATLIAGGGVWGSMVEDFLVRNCTTHLCGDVGIDFEGSHRCEAADCTAINCGNGNYATFMYCLGDVAFRRCKSILTQDGTCHYFDSHYGAGKTGGPAERHVLFEDCEFTAKKPTFIKLPCPMAEFKFAGNKCVNAQIDKRGANLGRFICEGNTFEDGQGNSMEAVFTEM